MNTLSGHIRLDFRASEPLYLQIARQIERLVVEGALKSGDQLPTVRELATDLRINFNTVARAYRLLDESRLISTQRGRGTYIWEEPTEETMEKLRKIGLEEMAGRYLREALRLGYNSQDAVKALEDCVKTGLLAPDDQHVNEEEQ